MTESDYIQTVEDRFIEMRNGGLVLSPIDADLLDSWMQEGIPVQVVVNAIERVFQNLDNRGGEGARARVRSLSYCTEEVEAQYEEWLEMRVGAPAEVAA